MEEKRESALVVLSGGQDSTTCLYWALEKYHTVHAVTFFYGQRHAAEMEAATEIARNAWVKTHHHIDLTEALAFANSDLLAGSAQEPRASGGYADSEMPEGLPTSFVPGRNLLFLSVAASLAVRLGVKDIVTGVCQTDYSGYPDCREQFVRALEAAVNEAMPSSAGPLHIVTPLMHLTKADTVRMAHGFGPDCWTALALTVTCYLGKRPGCGECPACLLRAEGFKETGLEDPAVAP